MRSAIAVALVLCTGLVAGCEGNGEPDAPPPTGTPDPTPPPAAWEPTPANIRAAFLLMKPPTISPEDASADLTQVLTGADSAVANDILLFPEPRTPNASTLRLHVECEGRQCWQTYPDGSKEPMFEGDSEISGVVPIGEQDGIVLFTLPSTPDAVADGFEATRYGAWATHSGFLAFWGLDTGEEESVAKRSGLVARPRLGQQPGARLRFMVGLRGGR